MFILSTLAAKKLEINDFRRQIIFCLFFWEIYFAIVIMTNEDHNDAKRLQLLKFIRDKD